MVAVAIPTLCKSPWLRALILTLRAEDHIRLLLMSNTDGPPSIGPVDGIEAAYCPGAGIYQMWNRAIDWAHEWGEPTLLLLNDDIEVPTRFAVRLAAELVKGEWGMLGAGYDAGMAGYQDRPAVEVEGTYRVGGLGGFAFALDLDCGIRCDEGYQWWYGDDDLVYQHLAAGHRVGRWDGCQIVHHQSTTVNQEWERLAPAVAADHVYHFRKWPHDTPHVPHNGDT